MVCLTQATTKVGIISDIHMKLDYNPASHKHSCGPAIAGEPLTSSDLNAPLGRLGCDPPFETVEMMIQAFVKE
jgi:hypothetical protein